MGVENLELGSVHNNGGPDCAPGFQMRLAGQSRQLFSPDQTQGKMSQDGVAVSPLFQLSSGKKVEFHIKKLGDEMRLVDAVSSGSTHVQFLKRNNECIVRTWCDA